MSWKRVIPMLSVADLGRTIAFYRDQLGFELVASFGDPEPVWCHLKRDSTHFMFNAPNDADLAAIPPRARDFQVFYIYPEDVAALHGELAARGLPVSPLRVTVYGMREFELRDPDGHWLWFGEATTDAPTIELG